MFELPGFHCTLGCMNGCRNGPLMFENTVTQTLNPHPYLCMDSAIPDFPWHVFHAVPASAPVQEDARVELCKPVRCLFISILCCVRLFRVIQSVHSLN